jgi:hypothetical protein
MFAAQPVRAGWFYGHQAGDSLFTVTLQPGLFIGCKQLQVARDLMVVRCDEDEAFALRALFEFEDALNSLAIVRVATQAITGFGGIGDEAAAFEVGGN